MDKTPPTITLSGPGPDEYGGIDPGRYPVSGTFSDNCSGLWWDSSQEGGTGWFGVVVNR